MNQYAEHTKKCKSINVSISTSFIWIHYKNYIGTFLDIQPWTIFKSDYDDDYISLLIILEAQTKNMIHKQ